MKNGEWSEVKWRDLKRGDKASKSGGKWSEVKWRFLIECVLSWTYRYAVCMWVSVQNVILSHLHIAICFLPFALCCVLINCFVFLIIRFMFVFLFCMFCFLFYVSVFFCMVLFIVSPRVYSCLYSICVHFCRPLPPGRNLFAVYKYHNISYQILHRVSDVDGFRGMKTLRAVVNAVMNLWVL